MNTTIKSLIAVLMATTFSTAAIAQTANVGTDTGASVGGTVGGAVGDAVGGAVGGAADTSVGADMSTNASGNAAATAQSNGAAQTQNYGQLISGLQTGEVSAETLSSADAETEATIVVMSDLKGNAANNASALENALSKQEENISDLRTSIEANAALKEKLEAEGYSVDQVVAVNTTTSGEITLVVDDNI